MLAPAPHPASPRSPETAPLEVLSTKVVNGVQSGRNQGEYNSVSHFLNVD